MLRKKGNNYIVDEENNIAKIELNRRNGNNFWVIIDLEDLERVIKFPYTWFAKFSKTANSFYACASHYLPGVEHSKTILMHQFILGIEKTTCKINVDHINHNTLDNRKCNLRAIKASENAKIEEVAIREMYPDIEMLH